MNEEKFIEICPNCGCTDLEYKLGRGRFSPALKCMGCKRRIHPIEVKLSELKEIKEEIKERGEIEYFEESPYAKKLTKGRLIFMIILLGILLLVGFLPIIISLF